MNRFNYAIWFIPEESSDWHNYTNGFIPHMTIQAYLTYDEAVELYNIIKVDIEETIVYLDTMKCSSESDFSALYYDILTNSKYDWWPADAHISFRYSYKPFTENDIEDFNQMCIPKIGVLDHIRIVNCNGFFKDWAKKNDII